MQVSDGVFQSKYLLCNPHSSDKVWKQSFILKNSQQMTCKNVPHSFGLLLTIKINKIGNARKIKTKILPIIKKPKTSKKHLIKHGTKQNQKHENIHT
jgi:hypothetical protein